ncbi:MAG: MotA/TolQ/ExbB proton channel family protein [Elusimicrobia bacterium]|nr:MotA/TolQ/ExbB proton channel family protein [Elusimicrobiota bacterium]
MDITTLSGIVGVLAMVLIGGFTGELSAVFLNAHGIVIVFGGTAVAMLINTPLRYVRETLLALAELFRGDRFSDPGELIPVLVRLSEQVQAHGLGALRGIDERAAGGFLGQAATTAMEYNNPDFVRRVLETEVNNRVDRANEVINVVRTMGVVAPMFGLLGTLIGIVRVMAVLTDPVKVAPAMAVAITTAFYGIALANLVAVPMAGKMRFRLWEEIKVRAMVIEGVIGMMQGTVPLVLERRLQAFK